MLRALLGHHIFTAAGLCRTGIGCMPTTSFAEALGPGGLLALRPVAACCVNPLATDMTDTQQGSQPAGRCTEGRKCAAGRDGRAAATAGALVAPACCASTSAAPGAARQKSAKRRAAEALLAARYSPAASPLTTDSGVASPLLHLQRSSTPLLSAAVRVLQAASDRRCRHTRVADLPAAKRTRTTAAATSADTAAAAAAGALPPASSGQKPAPAVGSGMAAAPAAASAAASGSSAPTTRLVSACPDNCHHPSSEGWCHQPVRVPHISWDSVVASDAKALRRAVLAPGYERFTLPHGIEALLVENAVHVPAALARLRASMVDSHVAIDLEWRPEFGRSFTPVALLQLASPTLAVLVRTCRMQYRLPDSLRTFLADPDVTLVGFHWDGADEGKMLATFGAGGDVLFGRMLDLRQVAHGLGYDGFGLQRLTQNVLGVSLPKARTVTMSNWEARVLTQSQVQYAALDVLMAGQVFRGLRLWHSSPAPCAKCKQPLGAVLAQAPPSLVCGTPSCAKVFLSLPAYLHHCTNMGHSPAWAQCSACGRVCRPQQAV